MILIQKRTTSNKILGTSKFRVIRVLLAKKSLGFSNLFVLFVKFVFKKCFFRCILLSDCLFVVFLQIIFQTITQNKMIFQRGFSPTRSKNTHFMKKHILLVSVLTASVILGSCTSNMRRDVKRLSHKTEKCFSLISDNFLEENNTEEFNKCYEQLEVLMNKYDKKYSNPQQSAEFSKLFIEEIRKSDLSDGVKEIFEQTYSLSN